MKNQSTLFNLKDLVVYFLIAGTGAAVQFISGSFFRNYTDFYVSVSLGYIVSFFVGFTLTKLFAFDARNTNKTRREMVKFGMVAFFSFGITVGFAALTLHLLHSSNPKDILYQLPFDFIPIGSREVNVTEASSTLVGMGLSFISNYILHKTFTFKSTGFYDRAKAALNL
ncbi:MAG: GtrA family protein [Spirosomataceae bacterium]